MTRNDRESIRFVSPSDMPYLRVVRGTNVTNEFTRHVHHKFCIGTVHKGARVVLQGGASALITENVVFAINAGMSHSCRSQSGSGHDYSAICIDTEKLRNIASQISEKVQAVPYIRSVILFDAELAAKINEFFSLLWHSGSILQRESLLVSMLSALLMRHGNSPPIPCRTGSQHGAINRARGFIREHFAENLSLEDLAGVACLSPFHFQRLFVKSTGVSPHQYVMESRIEKAKELLLEGHSIAGAAIDTGFADQSHFTRAFKRIIGIAPGRYLQLHGKRIASGFVQENM
jgi:AraC-like DNA-binding protein